MAASRALLESTAHNIHDMHTLNYVSSPSQSVSEYFMAEDLVVRVAVPGTGAFVSSPVNFWDLVNQFVTGFLSSANIPLDDLQDPDYMINHMSLDKRAVAFV